MNAVNISPGKYIVAVSGGVDSMVLLDIARQLPGVEVIVAHCNHGIRPDSFKDEKLVAHYAKKYGLRFESISLTLGKEASEAAAREARYNFLHQCRRKYKAKAILTAHQQDDVIETAIINLMRGTGWRGIAPFQRHNFVMRPLLDISKNDLLSYARFHSVPWREDYTNQDERYLRNFVRLTVIPILDQKSQHWQNTFLQYIRKQQHISEEIDALTTEILNNKRDLSRHLIIMAPEAVGRELLQAFMYKTTGKSLPRPIAAAAVLFTKTARPHKIMPVNQQWQLRATLRELIVEQRADMIR